jgi:hypothetical protein
LQPAGAAAAAAPQQRGANTGAGAAALSEMFDHLMSQARGMGLADARAPAAAGRDE